jgi:hypothetical protein
MSREASDMPNSEKTHDAASIRRELAKTLRKFLPQNETPVAPAAEPTATQVEVTHDGKSVRTHLIGLVKKAIENHANEMAALRDREVKILEKAANVVDMKGNVKTIGARTPNPAPPTKPVGMDEGSGGIIVPGKKKANPVKKAEPPMAKPPSGSIPGKTTPQSQPGGAPAAGAPKSSAAPTAKKELCEHGNDCKIEKCGEMKKGDFGTNDAGRVATTAAQAAPSQALAGGPPSRSAAGVRGTPNGHIRMPGRDGTAGLVSPKMGAPAPAAPAAPAAGGVKLPRPTAPMAPLGRVNG